MNLTYAVDRLYESGWLPTSELDWELLDDGRRYPSVIAVQREFIRAGLELLLKQNLIFKCYRATWAPAGEEIDEEHPADEGHGVVVAACEREAAVYALAQLRQAQAERQFAGRRGCDIVIRVCVSRAIDLLASKEHARTRPS